MTTKASANTVVHMAKSQANIVVHTMNIHQGSEVSNVSKILQVADPDCEDGDGHGEWLPVEEGEKKAEEEEQGKS